MQKLKSVQNLKLHFTDASRSQKAKSTCTTLKISPEIKSKNQTALSNCWFTIGNTQTSELQPVSLTVHLTTAVISPNEILSRSALTARLVLLL